MGSKGAGRGISSDVRNFSRWGKGRLEDFGWVNEWGELKDVDGSGEVEFDWGMSSVKKCGSGVGDQLMGVEDDGGISVGGRPVQRKDSAVRRARHKVRERKLEKSQGSLGEREVSDVGVGKEVEAGKKILFRRKYWEAIDLIENIRGGEMALYKVCLTVVRCDGEGRLKEKEGIETLSDGELAEMKSGECLYFLGYDKGGKDVEDLVLYLGNGECYFIPGESLVLYLGPAVFEGKKVCGSWEAEVKEGVGREDE